MKNVKQKYDEGWKALVKIDKFKYNEQILGPPVFPVGMDYIERTDFDVTSHENFNLKGTIFIPKSMKGSKKIPCVMFLHTRGGCRIEGMFLRQYFLPKTALCVFDFAGSGHSEGEYLSLGPKEKKDTQLVMEHIRQTYGVGPIFLWGRSMGAVTSILLAKENPEEIVGLVLDAPFSEMSVMVKDLITSLSKAPRCLIGCVLGCMFKTVKKKTGTELKHLKPVDWVKSITNTPAFFMVGKEDNLAKPERVKDVFDKYSGPDKQFYLIEGNHQTARDAESVKKGVAFALRCFSEHFYKLEKLKLLGSKENSPTKRTLNTADSVSDHNLNESDPTIFDDCEVDNFKPRVTASTTQDPELINVCLPDEQKNISKDNSVFPKKPDGDSARVQTLHVMNKGGKSSQEIGSATGKKG